MKIRLSEDEVYEIKMPDEIGIQDFQAVVSKFNFLLKNFTKFNIGGEENLDYQPTPRKEYDKQKWTFLKDNRSVLVEILKIHYLKTIPEFESIVAKHHLNLTKPDMCSDRLKLLREFHKITAQEVGLRAFPSQNVQVKHLILNNQGEKIK